MLHLVALRRTGTARLARQLLCSVPLGSRGRFKIVVVIIGACVAQSVAKRSGSLW